MDDKLTIDRCKSRPDVCFAFVSRNWLSSRKHARHVRNVKALVQCALNPKPRVVVLRPGLKNRKRSD